MSRQDHPSTARAESAVRARPPQVGAQTSILVRLGWMLGGTLAMLITLTTIANQAAWTLGVRDLGFWAAVGLTGALRYLDVTRFHGETTGGESATRGNLNRYLGGLGALAVVAWFAAQSVDL